MNGRWTIRRGFTLTELLTVVAIVVLMGTFALPIAVRLLDSGADAQAFNLIYAQLNAARTLAMKTGNYTCFHFQVTGTQTSAPDDVCFTGIFIYSTSSSTPGFIPAPGYDIKQLPGKMALGRITDGIVQTSSIAMSDTSETGVITNYVLSTSFAVTDAATGGILPGFTEGTVIFAPNGTVVPGVPQSSGTYGITFSRTKSDGTAYPVWSNIWGTGLVTSNTGISTLTLFHYPSLYQARYSDYAGGADLRTKWLNENGELIPINVYTGQLLSRR